MTEVAGIFPKYISLARCARLYGYSGRQTNRIYTMIARGDFRSEMVAGRPCVIFDSLPVEKQEQYAHEEAQPKRGKR